MANCKSALKRIKTNERNRQRNQSTRSRMKTMIKDALVAVDAKDQDKIQSSLKIALSEIDKAASKGVIHPNCASRKKSRLQRKASAALS